jgi:hypothetical protein
MAWTWQVPANAVVALPFWLDGPTAGGTVPHVCPPDGLRVFVGRAIAYQGKSKCPPTESIESLEPVEGTAVLGESCEAGNGSLLVNMTLPKGASIGSCWWAYIVLTDDTTVTAVFQFR